MSETPDLDRERSLATAQRSLRDEDRTFPLFPPLTSGDPEPTRPRYPLDVDYDYEAVDPDLFEAPIEPGLDRWAPVLPPLAPGGGLGEGATPLVESPGLAEWCDLGTSVYVKDESQNPTWSQKDRLNRCTIAAAVGAASASDGRAATDGDVTGIVVSSSGNHGASAAAYAARHGLPCVVLTGPETPGVSTRFIDAYDAAVVAMTGWDERMTAVDDLADAGFHPVSSRTPYHTGHPFGPEGYKTIAYEVVAQLGAVPGTVFVPTGFAEVLYGTWKGFRELHELGVVDATPAMVACEPAPRAPLAAARERGERFVEVAAADTDARSIQATRDAYRGHLALEESGGFAVPFTDLDAARGRLANAGFWQETAGAASVAGLHEAAGERSIEGPVVCLATSSGFKDGETVDPPAATRSDLADVLRAEYGLDVA